MFRTVLPQFETGRKRNITDNFHVPCNTCGIFLFNRLKKEFDFFLKIQGYQRVFHNLKKTVPFQKKLWKALDKNKKKEYNTDKNKNKHRKRGFDYGYDE